MMSKLLMSVVCVGMMVGLAGCPNTQFPPPPFDASGTYVGTWSGDVVSNEPATKQVEVTNCPLTLDLTQNLDGAFPTNFGVNGMATIDFSCIELPDRFPETPPSMVQVGGIMSDAGKLVLASGGCGTGVCALLTLDGQGEDTDNDGSMDMYDGTWQFTIALAGVLPYQITGTFATDLPQEQ